MFFKERSGGVLTLNPKSILQGGFIIKELFTAFGSYNLRARISVGIFFIAPWLLELYLLFPAVQKLTTSIVIATVCYSIANITILFARKSGSKALKRCFPELMPAQESLLPSNTFIDSTTKQRYYNLFSRHIKNFEVHLDDEQMKPLAQTAITWLIAQTRDTSKFPLIAEENMNLGFAYNLLGLKAYGIALSITGLAINATLLIFIHNKFITLAPELIIVSIILDIIFLLLWILLITKKLVIDCGRKYARALLAACDSPDLS